MEVNYPNMKQYDDLFMDLKDCFVNWKRILYCWKSEMQKWNFFMD